LVHGKRQPRHRQKHDIGGDRSAAVQDFDTHNCLNEPAGWFAFARRCSALLAFPGKNRGTACRHSAAHMETQSQAQYFGASGRRPLGYDRKTALRHPLTSLDFACPCLALGSPSTGPQPRPGGILPAIWCGVTGMAKRNSPRRHGGHRVGNGMPHSSHLSYLSQRCACHFTKTFRRAGRLRQGYCGPRRPARRGRI
jgi:hypothetical protein